jgi:hypothetical protein
VFVHDEVHEGRCFRRDGMVDAVALLFACLSGLCNGTFPIFIKTDAVLRANVHPTVFQAFKSSWVCIFGVCLLLIRAARNAQPAYEFTPWAVASATAWIPSGLSTIIAVPLIGVGSAVLTTAAVGSILSFFVFWLAFGEHIKVHNIGGVQMVIAPFYMLGLVVGMAGLVASHRWGVRRAAAASATAAAAAAAATCRHVLPCAETDQEPLAATDAEQSHGRSRFQGSEAARLIAGYTSAAISGVFSATQYGVVTLGKHVSGAHKGDERFDPLGSWMTTFGVSAVLVTLLAYAGAGLTSPQRGPCAYRPPRIPLRVMAVPGSAAGMFWTAANLFTTMAVLRDGNAIVMAQCNAASLITSGLWGLLWYKEVRGKAALAWVASAAFTTAMVVLLSFEKS